jgi:hypothetical protein
LPKLKFQPCI